MDRPPPQKRSHSSSSSDSETFPFASHGSGRSIPFISSLKGLMPKIVFDQKTLKRSKLQESMTLSSIFPGQQSSLAASVKNFFKSLETGDILPFLSVLATEISIAQEPVLLSIPMGKVLEGLKICLEHPASEVVLMAMNCIITIVEVAPNCANTIIGLGALPSLKERVSNPLYLDLAEKSIKIIEKISKSEGIEILNQDLFSSAISTIDFYETETQKSIINIGINILRCVSSPNQSRVLNNEGFISVFNYLSSSISLKVLEFIEIYLEKVENPEAHIYSILDSSFFNKLFEIFYSANTNKARILSIFKSLVKSSPRHTNFIFSPKFLDYLKETIEKGTGQEIIEVLKVALNLLESTFTDHSELQEVFLKLASCTFDYASLIFYKLLEINEHPLIVQIFEKLVKVLKHEDLESYASDPKFGSFLAEALGKKDFLTVNHAIMVIDQLLAKVPEICAVMMINEGVFSRLKVFKLIGEVNKLEKPAIKKAIPIDPYSFSFFSPIREKMPENTKAHNENVRKLVKIVKDILSNTKKFEKTAAQKSAKIQEIVQKIRENSETDFFHFLDMIQGNFDLEDLKRPFLKVSRYEFTNNDCGAVLWNYLAHCENVEEVLKRMIESPGRKVSYVETLFHITLDSFQFLQNLTNSSGKNKKTCHQVQFEYLRKDETCYKHPLFTGTPSFALNLSQFVSVENLRNSLLGLQNENDLNYFIESCKISSRISFVEGIHEIIEEGGFKFRDRKSDLEVKFYANSCLLESWMTIQDIASLSQSAKITISFEIQQKSRSASTSPFLTSFSESCRFLLSSCQDSGMSHSHKLFSYASLLKLCYLLHSTCSAYLPSPSSLSSPFTCDKLPSLLHSPSPERFLRSFAIKSSYLFSFKSRLKYFFSFPYMTRRQNSFKSTVNRKEIIKSATSLLNEAGNDHIEVDFLGEPGIGQGPTLEFFNLLSHEIQKLPIWVESSSGLFPHPEVEDFAWFKFVGQFVGKVILDKRIADLPISHVFLKQVFGFPVLDRDFQDIDPELYSSMKCLAQIPGGQMETLQLSFVLPGFKKEIVQGGSGVAVNDGNFLEFYWKVFRNYLACEQAADAFRSGLEQFVPAKDLAMFDPEELKILLCGENPAPWSPETLAQALHPAHGFTQDSKTFRNLVQILADFKRGEQEKFVKFVTGSPKLPAGGLLNLNPKMTVVKKEDSGDSHLPSVMTCVNYLKVPDYSTFEILKKNLLYAMEECSSTFYLS